MTRRCIDDHVLFATFAAFRNTSTVSLFFGEIGTHIKFLATFCTVAFRAVSVFIQRYAILDILLTNSCIEVLAAPELGEVYLSRSC